MLLLQGDCLEKMSTLNDNSIDIIISDLPYGRFKHLEWDKTIDLEDMWKQFWRISKPNTPIFLFGDMKFGVQLINSQPKHFKYEIVWNKMKSTTPLLSRKRLGKATEYIFIFYKKQPIYNYAKYHKIKKVITDNAKNNNKIVGGQYSKKVDIHNNYEPQLPTNIINEVLPVKVLSSLGIDIPHKKVEYEPILPTNYITELMPNVKYQGKGGAQFEPTLPINVIDCQVKRMNKTIKGITEKPQGILEFLLKYFSNEGDTCLDCCMGSGSMGVACNTLDREFIGIELNKEHFDLASERLNN